MDIYHTSYYAAGYMFKQVNPRMAAICHFEWGDDQLMAESVAEVRSHWEGLFMFGPDLNVINITKDAIWSHQAVISNGVVPTSMEARWFVPSGMGLPESIDFPTRGFPGKTSRNSSFVTSRSIRRCITRRTQRGRQPKPGQVSRSGHPRWLPSVVSNLTLTGSSPKGWTNPNRSSPQHHEPTRERYRVVIRSRSRFYQTFWVRERRPS